MWVQRVIFCGNVPSFTHNHESNRLIFFSGNQEDEDIKDGIWLFTCSVIYEQQLEDR